MTGAEVQAYVRAVCLETEIDRLSATMDVWKRAAGHFASIVHAEAYEASLTYPILGADTELEQIVSDPIFRNTFNQLPISFEMVGLDNLIAPQRSVSLDLVESIKGRAQAAGMAGLLDLCLSSGQPGDMPVHTQQAPNLVVYSAPSGDFRFLGSFLKPTDDSDIANAHMGGAPVAAIVLLVGYGSPCVNVFKYRNRVVLNNGFHRAFALRSLGVESIPAVVQHVENSDLEFPPALCNLPRDYLLEHARPVLLKDFFNPDLVATLDEKPRRKMVKVQWGVDQLDVPV